MRWATPWFLILFVPLAWAKQSCVELLVNGEPSGVTTRLENQRENRIKDLLFRFFRKSTILENRTGRLALVPETGKVLLSSDEFDELLLQPLSQNLAAIQELVDLILGQASVKVNKGVLIVFHEGVAAEIQFYNPRELPALPFAKSELSGEIRAIPFTPQMDKVYFCVLEALVLSMKAFWRNTNHRTTPPIAESRVRAWFWPLCAETRLNKILF